MVERYSDRSSIIQYDKNEWRLMWIGYYFLYTLPLLSKMVPYLCAPDVITQMCVEWVRIKKRMSCWSWFNNKNSFHKKPQNQQMNKKVNVLWWRRPTDIYRYGVHLELMHLFRMRKVDRKTSVDFPWTVTPLESISRDCWASGDLTKHSKKKSTFTHSQFSIDNKNDRTVQLYVV